jgi:uncharacterized phage protein gp47/JayE
MAGVTPEGFVAKTIEEIKAEIEDDMLATMSPSLNLSPDQPWGQINAAQSKKLAELWEVAAIAYNAFDRDAAEGRLLDNVGSLTGSPRDTAKKSKVTVDLVLGASFSQPAGAMMCDVVGEPTIKFVNRDPVVSTTAGTYQAVFEAVDYGPVVANSGTLTHITNPISGWTSVTNPLDAELGALAEEDPAYRQRQDDELTAAGSSTVDAIRTDLLEVKKVLQAYVFENVTLVTDGNGLPGKAIECVIYDGTSPTASDTEIAQAIWDSKPSGSQTFGTSSAIAIDKLGIAQTVYFSRATVLNVYLEFDIKVDASKFPVGGAALVKETAVAEGNLNNLGDDVVALLLRSCVLAKNGGVAGVTDVIALRLGTSASPVGTANLTVTGRSIARFDTSRVAVNIV